MEFEEFMSQLGVFLARQELRVVFDNFDQNKDGNIAYAEFVNVLKVSHIIQFIKRTMSRPPTSLDLAQQALKKAQSFRQKTFEKNDLMNSELNAKLALRARLWSIIIASKSSNYLSKRFGRECFALIFYFNWML